MNERIKELALQAGPNIVKEFDQEDIDFCEKFALLIVGECINTVKLWEKDSRNHISYILERHFGVKK